MIENRVSASLTADEQQELLDALSTIRQKLPFLIDLTRKERASLPKMGDKSKAFVEKAYEVGAQNTGILPRSFEIEEMGKDLNLFNMLHPIVVSLNSLQELVEDTWIQTGSEAFTAALLVYRSVRLNGGASGLDSALAELAKRFERKAAPKKSDPEAAADGADEAPAKES